MPPQSTGELGAQVVLLQSPILPAADQILTRFDHVKTNKESVTHVPACYIRQDLHGVFGKGWSGSSLRDIFLQPEELNYKRRQRYFWPLSMMGLGGPMLFRIFTKRA
jgi:hypothetical protein